MISIFNQTFYQSLKVTKERESGTEVKGQVSGGGGNQSLVSLIYFIITTLRNLDEEPIIIIVQLCEGQT